MEKSCGKIGIGITTYNRFNYYKQCLASIPRNEIDHLVIVNDGTDHYVKEGDGDVVFHNEKQLGIAKTKNKALFELVKLGVEHIFLIEDDILIKDPKVFQHYIKAAQSTGIHHLCYEKIAGNEESLKHTLEQPDGVKIGFYHNPQGAFMYINANLVKKLGYFDEQYMNAFEHIDFAYNLIKKNIAPPFWYFPDLLNSQDYLTDIEGSSNDSSITNKDKYNENLKKSAEYFVKKWGYFTNSIKDVGVDEVDKVLIQLQQNYSRKTIVNKDKKLSIIVPYRNRETARRLLLPRLKEYVSKQVENFEIIVVEQQNDKPFNKGLLNNIGFAASAKDSDYVCFHDVDLLPEFADYSYPVVPTHMSSHCSQFNYINIPDKIMGGVILFTTEHYKKVNGYSNEFNGWGKEDDDLYARCELESLKPYKSRFGRFYSVPHQHRLENPIENELHLKNGSRFRAFSEGRLGKNYHKKDGVSNCLEYANNITEEEKDGVKYITVNF
jgi:GT2 family glycosyltransferase